MNNSIISLFMICFIISSCSKKDNAYTINYLYNEANPLYVSTSLETDLTNNISVLNKLCEKLKLNPTFKMGSITKLGSNDSNVLLNSLKGKKAPDVVNVYLSGLDSAEDNAFFNEEYNYIRMPFADRFEIRILLHEIVHKIATDIDHVGTNNKVDGCTLVKNNYCLNLMATYELAPFNFLITESQREWINKGERAGDCTDKHAHPKDLLDQANIELLNCCPKPTLESKEAVSAKIGRTISENHFNELKNMLDELEKINFCPLTLDSTKIFPTLEKLNDYRNSFNVDTDVNLDTQYIIFHTENAFPISYNSTILYDIHNLYITEYLNLAKIQLLKEAEYLTAGTNVSTEFYLNNRFSKVKNNLNARSVGVKQIVDYINDNFN